MPFVTATFAMGTRFELVLERDDPHARAAAEAAVLVIEECDARLSRFRSDSLVSRINREAGAGWVQVDRETFELLERCLGWREATGGAFDVCVGKPMDRVRAGSVPSSGSDELRAGAFELDAATSSVRFTRPDTALDLGAVGKGHALDLAGECLRGAGIACALLHGGTSSVLALGAPPTSPEGWRVDLGPEFEHATAHLLDRALSVSASHSSRSPDQARLHILDPRDGSIVEARARAAVRSRSARDAEAWSTALLINSGRDDERARGIDALGLPEGLEILIRRDNSSVST